MRVEGNGNTSFNGFASDWGYSIAGNRLSNWEQHIDSDTRGFREVKHVLCMYVSSLSF